MFTIAALALLGNLTSEATILAVRPLPGQVIVVPAPRSISDAKGVWRWLVFSDRLRKRIPGGDFVNGPPVKKGSTQVIEFSITLDVVTGQSLLFPLIRIREQVASGVCKEGESAVLEGPPLFVKSGGQSIVQKFDLASLVTVRSSMKMIYAQAERIDLAKFNFPQPMALLRLVKFDEMGKVSAVGSTRVFDLGGDLNASPRLNAEEEELAGRGFSVTWSHPPEPENRVVSLNLLPGK